MNSLSVRNKVLVRDLKNIREISLDDSYKMFPDNSQIGFNLNPKFTGRDHDLIDLCLKMKVSLSKISITHSRLSHLLLSNPDRDLNLENSQLN